MAGCQTAQQEEFLWVRTDGQVVTGNPALQARGELDRTICFGEVQKAAAGAPVVYYRGLAGAITAAAITNSQQRAYVDIMKGCMAERGYVLVPRSEAESTAARYKAALTTGG